jgi:hypothetical protein
MDKPCAPNTRSSTHRRCLFQWVFRNHSFIRVVVFIIKSWRQSLLLSVLNLHGGMCLCPSALDSWLIKQFWQLLCQLNRHLLIKCIACFCLYHFRFSRYFVQCFSNLSFKHGPHIQISCCEPFFYFKLFPLNLLTLVWISC